MNLSFLHGQVSFNIYNIEMLEKIRAFQGFIRDKNKNLKGFNVFLLRTIFMCLVAGISLFLNDLRVIYAINGIFLNSFIGLIIPGLLGLARAPLTRAKDSPLIVFADYTCIFAGVFALLGFFVSMLL